MFSKAWECRTCGKCVEPVNKEEFTDGVWKIEFCPFCDDDDSCPECKGRNGVPVFRCPRAASRPYVHLLPYFFDWWLSMKKGLPPIWPDGRGRLLQPVKLVRAFNLLSRQMHLLEELTNE